MIIKSQDKSRGKWPLGIVELFPGRDGVVTAAKSTAGRNFLERPVQHLYPLELSCDKTNHNEPLNAKAPEFRPKRREAFKAQEKIKQIVQEEQES